MTEYFIELLNVLLTYIPTTGLLIYPMWKSKDIKNRTVVIFALANLVFLNIALLVFKQMWGMTMQAFQAFQAFKLFTGIPTMILPYFMFRKRVWQNIFLLSCDFAYNAFSVGISNYIESNWFAAGLPPFMTGNIAGFCIFALTLPALCILLRRLCENKDARNIRMWRFIWLLPAVFAAANLLTNSFLANTYNDNLGYIVNRVFSYVALLITCYLLDSSMRQAVEAVAARREAYELATHNNLLNNLNRSKTEFLQDMSHEMKNPLTVIATGIDYTDKEVSKSGCHLTEARHALDIIRNETQRLGRMVSGMVTMASMSDVGERRRRVNFAALLRNGAQALQLAAEKKNCTLTLDIPDDLPGVYIESDNYTRVIANLLSNAIDHTQNGRISLSAETGESYITIRVTDTGEGIPQDIFPYVFDRGVSGRGNTGYGLYICKAVVEAHGGTIGIESKTDEGTAVTFTIPVYSGQEVGHRFERKTDSSR